MKRFICFLLLFALTLSACNNTDTTSPTSGAVSAVSFEEVSSNEEVSSFQESSKVTSTIEEGEIVLDDGYDGFISVSGKDLVDESGNEYLIKGMAFGNNVFQNPSSPSSFHHTESDYEVLANLGFNCVRFYFFNIHVFSF